MTGTKDITHITDIQLLVDNFYGKVREDDLLGPIFNNLLQDRWPEHLEKMYRFWDTVLLDSHTYHGAPFHPHATLPVNLVHFERWVQLFRETVYAHFTGAKADEACWRGEKMAQMFLSKIEYYQGQPPLR
ncbi:group III truncated hemoglobin [Chitinophaga qingshengii]|uniref:Group III truncated hemoglobin n=1 Tax=Chitinophaga qingshengii TaxID=1569794 RepID=A0ABR7THT0_9BACT|nr:group III truncated hemoglobin [Chitinophaga qingshengii]MBC9930067.1 group III truncated hemoglobin [Chitinophaga qingshengii]